MKCKNCGKELREGIRFCDECGAPTGAAFADIETANAENRIEHSGNIVKGADGKYRWRYDMSLYSNLSIYAIVWKIFFWIMTAGFGIMAIVDLINGDFEYLLDVLKMYGIFVGGMTVFTLLCYYIYAIFMGGKYCVEFEMDEKGINHKQTAAQAKKARKLGAATAIAGGAGGSLTAAGVGLNSMRTEMYSEFDRVRKVKAYPRRHTIKINQKLSHNQVYAAKEDFDFVKGYILSHCKNLKK